MRRALPVLSVLVACVEGEESSPDASVVYGVLDTLVFLYDQNLIGRPTGGQDASAECPLGGTVHITGTTAETDSAVIDLVFDMAGCANSGTGYNLAFTGIVGWSGSFRSTGYKALGATADPLEAVGDAGGEAVDASCALAVTDRGEDGATSTVSGEWGGRSVAF